MGTMETASAVRTRNTKIQRAILKTVATAGLLSVALLAPNVLQLLKMFGYKTKKRNRFDESVNHSRERLLEKGLLEYKDGFLRLTEVGTNVLAFIEASEFKIKKPRRWDKKWRILIFDIREERRSLREKVRRTLVSIGFVRLQDSVWVYPYDCEDLITLLKADFKVGKDVLYIIADTIENDTWLKNKFSLLH